MSEHFGVAKPLSINEIARSDWVVVKLLTTGKDLRGYTLFDKLIVYYLTKFRPDLCSKIISKMLESCTMEISVTLSCDESDDRCRELAQDLSVRAGETLRVCTSIVAIRSDLIDWKILEDKMCQYMGDDISMFYVWYGGDAELRPLMESVYLTLMSSYEEAPYDVKLSRRGIVVGRDLSVSVLSF